MRPADTTPEAHAVQIAIYRRLGPGGRLALALRLSDDVRAITRSGIRARHPEYSDDQVEQALRRLLLGDDLFRQAYTPAGVAPAMTDAGAGGFLDRLTARLRAARVPYMVVGSSRTNPCHQWRCRVSEGLTGERAMTWPSTFPRDPASAAR